MGWLCIKNTWVMGEWLLKSPINHFASRLPPNMHYYTVFINCLFRRMVHLEILFSVNPTIISVDKRLYIMAFNRNFCQMKGV